MTFAGRGTVLLVAATGLVLAAVVAAIYIEPPQAARQKRLDERRVRDLMSLDARMNEYWNRQKRLPQSLAELSTAGLQGETADPETQVPYRYEPTGELAYRLCANFATESSDDARVHWPAQQVEWAHSQGQQCFDRKVRQRPG